METKELKIDIPEGYEVDKENSTFECLKFKPIKNKLPKTWDEFCDNYPRKDNECYIQTNSEISTMGYNSSGRSAGLDRNILPNKETAVAMLALCQLIQLRDCYNDGWVPDWRNDVYTKYTIYQCLDEIATSCTITAGRILAFKTRELRDQFLENFRDLIEIAKPLL